MVPIPNAPLEGYNNVECIFKTSNGGKSFIWELNLDIEAKEKISV